MQTLLNDSEMEQVTGGVERKEDLTVSRLTISLHAAEVHLGIDHPVSEQIRKCIDTFYTGFLIRDEVKKAVDLLLPLEDPIRFNIISSLNEALRAHREEEIVI